MRKQFSRFTKGGLTAIYCAPPSDGQLTVGGLADFAAAAFILETNENSTEK